MKVEAKSASVGSLRLIQGNLSRRGPAQPGACNSGSSRSAKAASSTVQPRIWSPCWQGARSSRITQYAPVVGSCAA
jgi:hypothetical protein